MPKSVATEKKKNTHRPAILYNNPKTKCQGNLMLEICMVEHFGVACLLAVPETTHGLSRNHGGVNEPVAQTSTLSNSQRAEWAPRHAAMADCASG